MNDRDIDDCLADLIETAAGAGAAFHAAAGEVRSDEARTLLLDRAHRYGQAAASVRALAAARGRGGARDRGAAATLPRIVPADEARILAESERHECAVVVAFRDALEQALPREVRAVVAREFETLLASLGSLRATADRAARQRRFVVGEPG